MSELLEQIAEAVEHDLFRLALAGALLVPDICAGLEADDGRSSAARYARWFNDHVASLYRPAWADAPILSGEMCYWFRASWLRQGPDAVVHPDRADARILFIEPGCPGPAGGLDMAGNTMTIDVRLFCLEVVDAGWQWRRAIQGSEPYETNLRRSVRLHADGYAPSPFR